MAMNLVEAAKLSNTKMKVKGKRRKDVNIKVPTVRIEIKTK